MPNAESTTPLAVRRDGKGRIWSHIRQGWFVEFPEEAVRQQYVCRLVNDYGFSLAQMAEEIATQHGRGSVEADLVIWRAAREKADAKPPLIVIACKADNVTISPKDYAQGESYARNVDAPFFRHPQQPRNALLAREEGSDAGLPRRDHGHPKRERQRQGNRGTHQEAQGLQGRRVR